MPTVLQLPAGRQRPGRGRRRHTLIPSPCPVPPRPIPPACRGGGTGVARPQLLRSPPRVRFVRKALAEELSGSPPQSSPTRLLFKGVASPPKGGSTAAHFSQSGGTRHPPVEGVYVWLFFLVAGKLPSVWSLIGPQVLGKNTKGKQLRADLTESRVENSSVGIALFASAAPPLSLPLTCTVFV